MIKHYVGITLDKADMTTIDRLGMMFKCERKG